MDIVLKADKNVCEISGWQSNTGEVNARNLTVEMCEEMCSCAMAFVTFELNNGTIYESLVVESKAEIPEVKEPQFVKIGVYSADIENGKCVKRYSPHPTNAYINNGSYSENGTEPPIPTAGTYAELLKKIDNIVLDADDIPNSSITIDKVNQSFFKDGIYGTDGEDIRIILTQQNPSKRIILTAVLKNKTNEITKENADEIPTTKAVIDYVQSVLPPSAEEVEY